MLDENLAYDLRDGSEVAADATENRPLGEKEQNKRDCHYLFDRIHAELTRRRYKCEISGSYPFNITVSAPSRVHPNLVIMRDRTGRFIAGPVGGAVASGSRDLSDDLAIFRSRDREEVLDHVERYVNLTSPRSHQPPAREAPEPSKDLGSSGALMLTLIVIAAAMIAVVVGARLTGVI